MNDLLADKLAVAAELIRSAEQAAASDFADWSDVTKTLDRAAETIASARRTVQETAAARS